MKNKNYKTIEKFAKQKKCHFSQNDIRPFYLKKGINYEHNDVENALNFLVGKLLSKKGGVYEILDETWTCENYFKGIEEDKKLKSSAIELNELNTKKLKKILKNYNWIECRNWLAFFASILLLIMSIIRCNKS